MTLKRLLLDTKIESHENGVKQGIEIGLELGKVESIALDCQEDGKSFDDAVQRVMRRLNITNESAIEMLRPYWNQPQQ